MQKENSTPMAFQFTATKQDVRSLVIENEPWFVAKDICDILELTDTNMSLKTLDDDEKLTQKIFGSGQNRKMWLVNESGLYALIMRSNKPEAKTFRKWVTGEVLPTIRRKGYFGAVVQRNEFIDARDVPYTSIDCNSVKVKMIELEGIKWFHIADFLISLKSTTKAKQTALNLNRKQNLAQKIYLYGATNPAWFTNEFGLRLIASGSRVFSTNQLKLNI